MINDFEICGLIVMKPLQEPTESAGKESQSPEGELNAQNDVAVKKLIKNFDEFYRPRDLRKDLTPYGIFLSREFIVTEILPQFISDKAIAQEIKEKALENFDENGLNCVYLRLGLTTEPKGKKVSLSWIMRFSSWRTEE